MAHEVRATTRPPVISRRTFLALMAASAATGALAPRGGRYAAPVGAAPAAIDLVPAMASASPSEADCRELGERVTVAMQRLQVPGVAVGLLHGDREYVAGFGVTNVEHPLPVDGDTLFQIGSLTKTYTGTALMRLVEAGRLDLDSPVRRWLPDLALADEGVAAAVTLRHGGVPASVDGAVTKA